MSISNYYADRDNCTKELALARKVFTSTESTVAEWDAVEKALGLMYLYCPQELVPAVYSTLNEITDRRSMLEFAGKL